MILATGSEVSLALDARTKLQQGGRRVRVVSMPSWELLDEQPAEYLAELLPAGLPRLSIEAAASLGWHRWVGADGDIIAIDRFGASASEKDIMARFGFDTQQVVARAEVLLQQPRAGER